MRKKGEWIFLFVIAFSSVFFSAGQGGTQNQEGFLNWKECVSCHEQIVLSWQNTRHAKAFESLKKTSQEGLPACLPCHVTGYDEPGGYVDFELTPELIGVQCEECHGPGKPHITNPGEKSSVISKVGEKKCKKCHTPGQDPNFNYGRKSKLTHSQ
jgi:hypothetical protein